MRTEDNSGAGEHGFQVGLFMDNQTRNEFEHYCALAEIEEDPEKFAEISRNIRRLLDEKQALLSGQRPGRVRYPAAPSNVA